MNCPSFIDAPKQHVEYDACNVGGSGRKPFKTVIVTRLTLVSVYNDPFRSFPKSIGLSTQMLNIVNGHANESVTYFFKSQSSSEVQADLQQCLVPLSRTYLPIISL